jgi:hypothetical protein
MARIVIVSGDGEPARPISDPIVLATVTESVARAFTADEARQNEAISSAIEQDLIL